ncbi:MAG: ATP phosphoribosyltransferase regulatory subunit [Phycisphaerales bacterium]|nr:ATP phosphoribosyltransferase regulatory subunit [Phycisphaerales bacterium]
MPSFRFQSPKGTRDLYPDDVLARRYLTQAWRDVAIRHGFDEIEGPTFETTELYAVKSGEGILGELFQAFSGKAEEEVAQVRETGRAPYALRPEFTPTLARMYAARAQQLPKPCKWFTAGPYFRAERPQRGRLREFLQWNIDFLGDDGSQEARAAAEAEVIGCSVQLCRSLGLSDKDFAAKVSHRGAIAQWLTEKGVGADQLDPVMQLLDAASKLPVETIALRLGQLGLDPKLAWLFKAGMPPVIKVGDEGQQKIGVFKQVSPLFGTLIRHGLVGVVEFDLSIVRGLAYYTGTVFELIAEGERAICGGGRYDNLIELFGGPPTPAVGFGMGDVVLSLLLEEKGLIPQGPELAMAVSRRPASVRPDVFVVSADDEATDRIAERLVFLLRHGLECEAWRSREDRKPWHPDRYDPRCGGVRPLHARHTYKSTRNLKKLLADAERQMAKFAAIVHGPDRVQLKHFDARKDLTPGDLSPALANIAEFSVDPASPAYVGRAVAALA